MLLLLVLSLYPDNFLDIGVKSCSGLGQFTVALPVDGYQNPAASSILSPEFSFYAVSLFGGMEFYGALGGILKRDRQGFSFYLIRFYSSNIPDTRDALNDKNGNGILDPGEGIIPDSVKYFSIADNAAVINYSQKIFKNTTFGISTKGIYRDLYVTTGYRLGMDVGLHHSLTPDFSLGFVVKDIFSTPEYFSNNKIYAGRRYIFGFGGKRKIYKWLASYEGDFFFDNNTIGETFKISGKYKDFLGLSLGLSDDFILLGADFTHRPFRVDYTLNLHTDLPVSNLISITYYPG